MFLSLSFSMLFGAIFRILSKIQTLIISERASMEEVLSPIRDNALGEGGDGMVRKDGEMDRS